MRNRTYIIIFTLFIGLLSGNGPEDAPSGDAESGGVGGSCSVKSLCCFAAGTKVLMGNGTVKNIEDVVVGDTVKTVNIYSLKVFNSRVKEVSSPLHEDIVNITFADGSTNTNTFDHSYFIKGGSWSSYKPELTKNRYNIDAGQLEVGDIVYKIVSGKLSELEVAKIVENVGEIKTYNIFTDRRYNSYFANGILVHNETILDNGGYRFDAQSMTIYTDSHSKKFKYLKISEIHQDVLDNYTIEQGPLSWNIYNLNTIKRIRKIALDNDKLRFKGLLIDKNGKTKRDIFTLKKIIKPNHIYSFHFGKRVSAHSRKNPYYLIIAFDKKGNIQRWEIGKTSPRKLSF